MGDQVSPDIQQRILTAVRQSHSNNLQRVQQWDSKVRSLYTVAARLINDGVESLRGFGRIQTALDVHQQSNLRRVGPFVRSATSSTTSSNPSKGKDKGSTCAMFSAYNVERKRRSRGRGRHINGQSLHPTPPPVSAPPKTSTPLPAVQPVFCFTDARP